MTSHCPTYKTLCSRVCCIIHALHMHRVALHIIVLEERERRKIRKKKVATTTTTTEYNLKV